jgi:dimethylargininase
MLQLHVRSLASLALKQTTTRRIIFNTTIRNPSSSKNYTSVAIRGVPNSFSNALAKESPTDPISVPTAVQQHEVYKEYLSCIVPRVIDLEADESYPDCVFIEDTAIVIDDQAVITRIGADSRKGEVDAIKEALVGIGLKVTDMRSDDNDNDDNGIATCDGGDVLYPVSYTRDPKTGGPLQKRGGNHLFVGISSRTNHAGANFLQRAFPHIEVVPVELGDLSSEALHLKSIVTHLDERTLLIPKGEKWDILCDKMRLEELGYEVIRLPDIKACNVVSVNGKVIAQPNICEESIAILFDEVQKRGMTLIWVDASEFSKCDGALTCKSILIP